MNIPVSINSENISRKPWKLVLPFQESFVENGDEIIEYLGSGAKAGKLLIEI